METISIDDCAPMPVRRPATVAELCDLVKQARAADLGVYPVGGRTTLDVGLPPIKPGVAVETTALNRVIDYPARDMTITVQAGITIAALQAALAEEGQWLPVDVASPEKATLGGAIALNQSGPRRYGHGTLRDYVIGISFVTDDGVEVKAGGRVVKNVAGYDLMKLQIGAVGTLGVITQVTLKVKPRPEAAAVVSFRCDLGALPACLDALHASRSRPGAVLLRYSLTTDVPGPWWLAAVYEEKPATVDWQVATLLAELKSAPAAVLAQRREANAAHDAIRPWADEPAGAGTAGEPWWCFKANVRPSRTAEFCLAAVAPEPTTGFGVELELAAAPLNGIVVGNFVGAMSLEAASATLHRLTELAGEGGGNVTVRRCPAGWKTSLPVWGKPAPARDLMRHVKKTLDPDNVFNPGRLFGDV